MESVCLRESCVHREILNECDLEASLKCSATAHRRVKVDQYTTLILFDAMHGGEGTRCPNALPETVVVVSILKVLNCWTRFTARRGILATLHTFTLHISAL